MGIGTCAQRTIRARTEASISTREQGTRGQSGICSLGAASERERATREACPASHAAPGQRRKRLASMAGSLGEGGPPNPVLSRRTKEPCNLVGRAPIDGGVHQSKLNHGRTGGGAERRLAAQPDGSVFSRGYPSNRAAGSGGGAGRRPPGGEKTLKTPTKLHRSKTPYMIWGYT